MGDQMRIRQQGWKGQESWTIEQLKEEMIKMDELRKRYEEEPINQKVDEWRKRQEEEAINQKVVVRHTRPMEALQEKTRKNLEDLVGPEVFSRPMEAVQEEEKPKSDAKEPHWKTQLMNWEDDF